MRSKNIISLLTLILTTTLACQKQAPNPIDESGDIISWSVQTPAVSKSLVNNTSDLRWTCTPADRYYPNDSDPHRIPGKGRAIGFYADYAIYDGPNIIGGTKNIFPVGTRLQYSYGLGYDGWYYGTSALSWEKGGTYHIRAFYPQSMESELISDSDAECIVLNYNTHTHQDDLMISGNRVHTKDPITGDPSISIYSNALGQRTLSNITGDDSQGHGYDHPFDLHNPIPLFFRHTMAAIRVQFTYSYIEEEEEEEDAIYSCYFTNGATGGLHTTGLLIYGDELTSRPVGDTQEDLEGRWKQHKWVSHQSMTEGVPFYEWIVASASAIPFKQTGVTEAGVYKVHDYTAIAYSGTMRQKYDYYENSVLISSTELSDDFELIMANTEGPYYNTNDGWLLIIPQAAATDLTLHFSTKKLGEISMKVPPITYTNQLGQTITAADPGHYFCEGYKYTYTVEVDEIDSRIYLSIAPWENILSTSFIEF